MEATRSEERHEISCLAYLFDRNNRALASAIMKDVLGGGATLVLGDPASIQDPIILKFNPHATNYRECIIRWRKEDSIGVLFIAKFDGFMRTELLAKKTPRTSRSPETIDSDPHPTNSAEVPVGEVFENSRAGPAGNQTDPAPLLAESSEAIGKQVLV